MIRILDKREKSRSFRRGQTHLILIKLAVFVLLFTLVLESDNNETNEDVHHEECYDNDVNDVVRGHYRPKIMNWSMVLLVRVDRHV